MKLARTLAAGLMAMLAALFVMPSGAAAAALSQSGSTQAALTEVPTTPRSFTGEGWGPLNIAEPAAYDSAYSQAAAAGYPSHLCRVTLGPERIWISGDYYQVLLKISCTPPPPEGSGPIVAVPNGKCVDVKDGSTKDGALIQLYKCHGGANQVWKLEADKTVRSMGRCMDVQYAKTENGSALGLNSCHGAANQQFELLPGGKLRSVHSGKCVDVVSYWTLTRLVIWDCSADRPYQQWRGAALGL
ncbi:ricin-type beta-trefoil lectin domain protein [Streptomyces sp. NPDC048258]|uniref:RICIN domain-containing protein n=1 Tax=Streptomyces sp. NPDC048258 TaxID=3365527 RepID=UPI003713B09F